MRYQIYVYPPQNISWRQRHRIKKSGCYYDKSLRIYKGYLTQRRYKQLLRYCNKNNIRCTVENNFSQRSADYRKNFFINNPPPILNRYYFCSYCGRLVNKNKITVDHLYPINAVKHDIRLQKKLKRKGMEDINDIKNLLPACKGCNSKKSDRMGLWLLKGKIGRYQNLWYVRHILKIAIVTGIICISSYWLYLYI